MRRFLPLIAILSLAFAPAPFPRPLKADPGKADLKKMQGEWECVSWSLNGNPLVTVNRRVTAVYDGNRMSCLTNGVATAKWVVTLDPSKEPKRMDLKDVNAPGETLLGIYKLDGDTLTCAFRNQANTSERPTDFNPHRLMGVEVYKRKKR
jgi:uncharacterized protein (TIGR03067 family)